MGIAEQTKSEQRDECPELVEGLALITFAARYELPAVSSAEPRSPLAHGRPLTFSFEMENHLKSVKSPETVEGQYFIYILLCSNGSFYAGQSNDVEKRLKTHQSGLGSKHTKRFSPLRLVLTEGPMTLLNATNRERQIKSWSRAKKIALIQGDSSKLKELSKSKER